ncbi:DUF4917 domain-containing protein [Bisbaumannia pacifica]|uniref:DUF4917 domain-containing protein n=1 Tax=Bisbaumannia pacifica TaxID=77098 RepID=A0A510XCJ7_9GAMM|nr:DUF4917 family protein [Halomonas pacifica]GEK46240.1 DUF4917 domain-containing protein [Halomonas pacifica]
MQTFQEAIDSVDEDAKPSIVLANGFSQAWNARIFNYENLLQAANFGDRDTVIRPLFQSLETYDFEAVSKQLTAAETVLRAYDPDNALIESIVSDRDVLKDSLITAISNTHPNLPSEITDDQYVAVRTFLSQFNEIFSINYDLLFYWARNKYNLAPENYRTDDGFRAQRRWEGHGTDQEVYFLHGGLHIYDTGRYIKKHACTDDGVTIIEQVRDNLEHGSFPLFVSEPIHERKRQRIDHNPYLNYCFQALGNLRGSLFIHGHSMDENDKHIFDQIKSSRVSKVFVSIYGDENTAANTRTKANAMAFLQGFGKSVEFYQAESAPVWA